VTFLEQSNAPEARKELVRAASHPLPDVREQAAFALARVNDPAAVPKLIEMLHGKEKVIQDKAADALVKFGASSISCLLKTLDHNDANMRATVVDILGKIRNPDAISGLLKVLRDQDKNLRKVVINALGSIGDGTAVPALVKLLHDEDPKIRVAVVRALGQIANPEAVKGCWKSGTRRRPAQ
jgi:HEAT repeat protein